MSPNEREAVHPLDAAALETFRQKGDQSAVKVRRVLQATKDLLRSDLRGVRVLDLGCAEGVYSIEAGLRGASVLAVDGRSGRLDDGRAIAQRLGLANVEFRIADVRALRKADLGSFDAVFYLGLQYHLDVPDVFDVMRNVHEMCSGVMILDTHIATEAEQRVEDRGVVFEGQSKPEHEAGADEATKRERLAASLDNVRSFWFTRESLYRLLRHVGFTSVFECHVPIEAAKPANRVTFAAVKGAETSLSAYPWINGLSEAEIAGRLSEMPGFKRFWEKPESKKKGGFFGAAKAMLRGKK
jgi:SAM-dependent methyltransferase